MSYIDTLDISCKTILLKKMGTNKKKGMFSQILQVKMRVPMCVLT